MLKDYPLTYLRAAYKITESLELPSSRTVSCKTPRSVRDQKNRLLPGARAELNDESWFIYLTLSHLPDVSDTTFLLGSRRGNSIIMNTREQTFKIMSVCCMNGMSEIIFLICNG